MRKKNNWTAHFAMATGLKQLKENLTVDSATFIESKLSGVFAAMSQKFTSRYGGFNRRQYCNSREDRYRQLFGFFIEDLCIKGNITIYQFEIR